MPNEQVEQLCQNAINLLTAGSYGDSIIAFQEILKIQPNTPLAWNNRGLALLNLNHPFDAILNIDRAIELAPGEPAYLNNKGAALFDLEDPSGAIACYDKAIELKSDFAEAICNRGNALKLKGEMHQAALAYRDAVKARPDYADAHLHLSFTQLALGNYEEGWKEFEWRWKTPQLPSRGLSYPEWDGSSLEGKTLLIYTEQGHGDCLQFIRYAPLVKEKFGGKIIVEVRQPMARLAKYVEGIDEIISFGEKVPKVDCMIAMMSLPRIFGTSIDTIPWNGPYIKVDPHGVLNWHKRFNIPQIPKGLRVGVCWAGMDRGAGHAAASAIDKRRSTTLATFGPLALVPGVTWVSLQKGPPAEQVKHPPLGMTIVDWTNELDDFYDTATLIANLDLVISVDTAVVHLAAAMGKPTWLLSRWDGCWRWLGNRVDSPWYPTLRQFTQSKPNDWATMMDLAAVALRGYVKGFVKKVA